MKILIAESIDENTVEKMKKMGHRVMFPGDENEKKAEVIVIRSKTKVDGEFVEGFPRLKAVIRAGVGLDNVDIRECEQRGVMVRNTPGASTNAVAELTIGAMITLMRNIIKGHKGIENKEWKKKECMGIEAFGKTLGIVGCGRIGRRVAEIAGCLGMKVIGYDPNKCDEIKCVEFDTLLRESDIISVHCPLTKDTENMFNSETIAKMKDGAILMNLGRGKVVDEEALYTALKTRKLSGAVLDVFHSEPYEGKLANLDNVVLTPHIGATTKEAQKRIGEEIISIIEQIEN